MCYEWELNCRRSTISIYVKSRARSRAELSTLLSLCQGTFTEARKGWGWGGGPRLTPVSPNIWGF